MKQLNVQYVITSITGIYDRISIDQPIDGQIHLQSDNQKSNKSILYTNYSGLT